VKTTFIPTRSGDGTFVLDFDPSKYTLVGDLFSVYLRLFNPQDQSVETIGPVLGGRPALVF
jgi:hypothetical protein